jgi:hypothetical protein
MRITPNVGRVITCRLYPVRLPTQLGLCPINLSIVTTARAFANKPKMSDSESENFDLDNVSDGSESDGYELPVKKASCSHSTRFSSYYLLAYVSRPLRKKLLPLKSPRPSSLQLLRRKPQRPKRLLNHGSFPVQQRRARF